MVENLSIVTEKAVIILDAELYKPQESKNETGWIRGRTQMHKMDGKEEQASSTSQKISNLEEDVFDCRMTRYAMQLTKLLKSIANYVWLN